MSERELGIALPEAVLINRFWQFHQCNTTAVCALNFTVGTASLFLSLQGINSSYTLKMSEQKVIDY